MIWYDTGYYHMVLLRGSNGAQDPQSVAQDLLEVIRGKQKRAAEASHACAGSLWSMHRGLSTPSFLLHAAWCYLAMVVPWKGAAGCTCEENKGVGTTPRAHASVWVNIPYELICAVGTTRRAGTIISVHYPHTWYNESCPWNRFDRKSSKDHRLTIWAYSVYLYTYR